jgi:hypothetical protein
MWYDGLPGNSWTSLWSGYIRCGADCEGIRRIERLPACRVGPLDTSPRTVIVDGREMTVHATFMGAEPQPISEVTVNALVGSLKAEHESWIAV